MLGRKDEALVHSRKVAEQRQELFGAESSDAVFALWHYAYSSKDLSALQSAFQGLRTLNGIASRDAILSGTHLAEELMRVGRYSEALAVSTSTVSGEAKVRKLSCKGGGISESCPAKWTQATTSAASVRRAALNNLAITALQEGRKAEGEVLMRKSIAGLMEIADTSPSVFSDSSQMVKNLANVLEDLGGQQRLQEAAALHRLVESAAAATTK